MVFLPLVAVTGVTGSFFRALAITMTVALLTSLTLALTWTPSLSFYLLRGKSKTREFPQPETDTGRRTTRPWPRRSFTNKSRRAALCAAYSGGISAA